MEDRMRKIEVRIQQALGLSETERAKLLQLVSTLREEVAALARSHEEDARSIAHFLDASTHEASRAKKQPKLLEAARLGLTASVENSRAPSEALCHGQSGGRGSGEHGALTGRRATNRRDRGAWRDEKRKSFMATLFSAFATPDRFPAPCPDDCSPFVVSLNAIQMNQGRQRNHESNHERR